MMNLFENLKEFYGISYLSVYRLSKPTLTHPETISYSITESNLMSTNKITIYFMRIISSKINQKIDLYLFCVVSSETEEKLWKLNTLSQALLIILE
jgi:hypothetical protein